MRCSSTTFHMKAALVHPLGRLVMVAAMLMALTLESKGQETDFSPYARFGLGTDQGILNPALAGMAGITTVTGNSSAINADQPASAAGLTHPTFQASIHSETIGLIEGDQKARAFTGGPGQLGLVVKQPRSRSALSFGMTPLSSKAFSIQRIVEDSLLGSIAETYSGSGGMARGYLGLATGWRGKGWVDAGSADSVLVSMRGLDAGFQVDHWFGDAIQTSRLDIADLSFRDVQSVTSMRNRATGFVLGVEAFQVLKAKYSSSQEFEGSWVLRGGATWSPERTLQTDWKRLVESTLILNGVATSLDTSSYSELTIEGVVPMAWSAGGSLQWDGPQGERLALFFDHHAQAWSSANSSLPHLMSGSGLWGDARRSALGLTWQRGRSANRTIQPLWRSGFSWGHLPVVLDMDGDDEGDPLQEWRASLGLTMPMQGSRSASQFHIGMDFGRRHTINPELHTESTLRFQIGVSLTPFVKNLWLTPRLYD
ncbi:MAG: hypothetical protein O3B70_01375 [Bacteroidetes bacterium]|nr:hypothetical protein [Bacteroidota bacterium]